MQRNAGRVLPATRRLLAASSGQSTATSRGATTSAGKPGPGTIASAAPAVNKAGPAAPAALGTAKAVPPPAAASAAGAAGGTPPAKPPAVAPPAAAPRAADTSAAAKPPPPGTRQAGGGGAGGVGGTTGSTGAGGAAGEAAHPAPLPPRKGRWTSRLLLLAAPLAGYAVYDLYLREILVGPGPAVLPEQLQRLLDSEPVKAVKHSAAAVAQAAPVQAAAHKAGELRDAVLGGGTSREGGVYAKEHVASAAAAHPETPHPEASPSAGWQPIDTAAEPQKEPPPPHHDTFVLDHHLTPAEEEAARASVEAVEQAHGDVAVGAAASAQQAADALSAAADEFPAPPVTAHPALDHPAAGHREAAEKPDVVDIQPLTTLLAEAVAGIFTGGRNGQNGKAKEAEPAEQQAQQAEQAQHAQQTQQVERTPEPSARTSLPPRAPEPAAAQPLPTPQPASSHQATAAEAPAAAAAHAAAAPAPAPAEAAPSEEQGRPVPPDHPTAPEPASLSQAAPVQGQAGGLGALLPSPGALGIHQDLSPAGLVARALHSGAGPGQDWAAYEAQMRQAAADSTAFGEALQEVRAFYQSKLDAATQEAASNAAALAAERQTAAAVIERFKELLRAQAAQAEAAKEEAVRAAEERIMAATAQHVVEERLERGAALDELRLQLNALQAALEHRTGQVLASGSSHKVTLGILALWGCLEAGRPCQQEVQALAAACSDDPVVSTALKALPAEVASTGLPTLAQLQQRFKGVRREAEVLSVLPEEGGGLFSYLLARLAAALKVDEGTAALALEATPAASAAAAAAPVNADAGAASHETGGPSREALLGRAQELVAQGRLLAAADALRAATAGTAAQGCSERWVAQARARASADQASQLLQAHASSLAASVA